jgi:hypothetical protein
VKVARVLANSCPDTCNKFTCFHPTCAACSFCQQSNEVNTQAVHI